MQRNHSFECKLHTWKAQTNLIDGIEIMYSYNECDGEGISCCYITTTLLLEGDAKEFVKV